MSSDKKKFVWQRTSEQQKLLESLVASGEAFKMKPIDLYQAYTLFQEASEQVFRIHLTKTKNEYFGNLTRDTTT